MDCEHENCFCGSEVGIAREGRTYCSDHCAEAQGEGGEAGCNCGHAGCESPESGTGL